MRLFVLELIFCQQAAVMDTTHRTKGFLQVNSTPATTIIHTGTNSSADQAGCRWQLQKNTMGHKLHYLLLMRLKIDSWNWSKTQQQCLHQSREDFHVARSCRSYNIYAGHRHRKTTFATTQRDVCGIQFDEERKPTQKSSQEVDSSQTFMHWLTSNWSGGSSC